MASTDKPSSRDTSAVAHYHVASSEAGRLQVDPLSVLKLRRATSRVDRVQQEFNARQAASAA